MKTACFGRDSKPVPGRCTIHSQFAWLSIAFKEFESQSQPVKKLRLRNVTQLRLSVVDVININTLKPHISQRLIELVLQIGGSHAMAAANDVVKRRNARFHKRFFNIGSNV